MEDNSDISTGEEVCLSVESTLSCVVWHHQRVEEYGNMHWRGYKSLLDLTIIIMTAHGNVPLISLYSLVLLHISPTAFFVIPASSPKAVSEL